MKKIVAIFLLGTLGLLIWKCVEPAAQVEGKVGPKKDAGSRPKDQNALAEEKFGKVAPVAATDDLVGELRGGNLQTREHALHVLLPRLVEADPNAAARVVLAWEKGSLRDEMIREIVRTWLARDVQGALKWIMSLAEKSDQQVAGRGAIDCLAQNDPASAIELALAIGIGTQDGSVEHMAQIWAQEKLGEAEAWVVAQPQGPDRDRLLGRIAIVHAERNPPEAAALVTNQMSPGAARDEAILGVLRRWAATDPGEAARWVAQFPPGPFRDRAVAELGTFSK